MSEQKRHTPGPWNVYHDEDGTIWIAQKRSGAITSGVIVEINPEFSSRPEANARLIAAAPDLLDALSDLSRAYAALRKRAGYGDDPSESLDDAIAAIAKATAP